jgi:T5SS/PEP-CTERM-associated repeat protein
VALCPDRLLAVRRRSGLRASVDLKVSEPFAALVSGPGSRWSNSGRMYIGGNSSVKGGSGILTIAIAGTLGFVGAAARYPHAIVYLALPLAIFALLVILGIHDLTQASCVTGRQTAVYFI